jgi:transposase
MNPVAEVIHQNPNPASLAEVLDYIRTLEQTLEQRNQEITRREQEIHRLEIKTQKLAFELAHLRRFRFGATSEVFSGEQKSLFEEDLDQDLAAVEAEMAAEETAADPVSRPASRRPHPGRTPLPPHLERIEVLHEPEHCTCPACQAALVKIGEEVTEQLHIEPAVFKVVRHIRPKYTCRICETVQAAPVAPAIINGGLPTSGLLAYVALAKYLDHLPLYRLEQMAERQGVMLSRRTMSTWIGQLGVALSPLVGRLAAHLRHTGSLHADETPVRQLDPGKGKTKRAYLWAYRSNDLTGGPPMVVFDYQASRSGQWARTFLADWSGHLMVDDYAGYKALFGERVIEQACWAHARRKFFELHAATGGKHPVAAEALERIGRLYAIEAEARRQGLSIAARQTLRAERAKPELQSLKDWLTHLSLTAAPGSGLTNAIHYLLRRWAAFAVYAETGHLPIDNNPVENAIRPIAIGKKNWLFAGSERAGKRAAAIQSLIGTARLNGIDPAAWLRDTLEKLPTWPNSRIDELLPVRWTNNS